MKQRVSLSIEEARARHLQRCAQRSTGGNVSAYVERLLVEDEMRHAVAAAADWYAAHPSYAEDSAAENEAAENESAENAAAEEEDALGDTA
ncbi:MAG: hypothetical protein ACT4RN_18530 [Pseudonocardia sp.]